VEEVETGLRTRLETTLAYRGGVGEKVSRGMCKFWTSLAVPRGRSLGSSSDPVWFTEGCEDDKSLSMAEYGDEVDGDGVIKCNQLSPSGGCTEAFIAEMDARSTGGGLSELEEDGGCSSRVYTLPDSSRDSSRALASSSSSWAINSCSRVRASSDAESVRANSTSFSSGKDTASETMGSGGWEDGPTKGSGIDVG